MSNLDDRDGFIAALIAELELQKKNENNLNIFEKNKELSGVEVFKKLCFDFPDINENMWESLIQCILKLVEPSTDKKGHHENDSEFHKFRHEFWYNNIFMENLISLSSSSSSSTLSSTTTLSESSTATAATTTTTSTTTILPSLLLVRFPMYLLQQPLKISLKYVIGKYRNDDIKCIQNNNNMNNNNNDLNEITSTMIEFLQTMYSLTSQLSISSLLEINTNKDKYNLFINDLLAITTMFCILFSLTNINNNSNNCSKNANNNTNSNTAYISFSSNNIIVLLPSSTQSFITNYDKDYKTGKNSDSSNINNKWNVFEICYHLLHQYKYKKPSKHNNSNYNNNNSNNNNSNNNNSLSATAAAVVSEEGVDEIQQLLQQQQQELLHISIKNIWSQYLFLLRDLINNTPSNSIQFLNTTFQPFLNLLLCPYTIASYTTSSQSSNSISSSNNSITNTNNSNNNNVVTVKKFYDFPDDQECLYVLLLSSIINNYFTIDNSYSSSSSSSLLSSKNTNNTKGYWNNQKHDICQFFQLFLLKNHSIYQDAFVSICEHIVKHATAENSSLDSKMARINSLHMMIQFSSIYLYSMLYYTSKTDTDHLITSRLLYTIMSVLKDLLQLATNNTDNTASANTNTNSTSYELFHQINR